MAAGKVFDGNFKDVMRAGACFPGSREYAFDNVPPVCLIWGSSDSPDFGIKKSLNP
jgi:hypothetical protein